MVVIVLGRTVSKAKPTGLGAEVSFFGFLDSLLDFC